MESVELRADLAAAPPQPRVQVINRQQLVLRPMAVEPLIPEDHPARAIWQLVGQQDLSAFYAPIKAVAGTAGREPVDPRLLISLWIYAYSEKIGSAREMERRCQQLHPGFGWLTGLTVINHHTLSDFRTAHGAALEQLFVEVLAVLSQAGLVGLERVMHDGMKIKANAADNSFRREPTLRQHLEAAQQQVQRLEQQAEQDPEGQARSRRQRRAQLRAVRERQQRIEQALAELEPIRAAKNDPQERAEARASRTDPEARIMKQAQGAIGPAYKCRSPPMPKPESLWAWASARPLPTRPNWPRRSTGSKPTPGTSPTSWWLTAALPIKRRWKPCSKTRSS